MATKEQRAHFLLCFRLCMGLVACLAVFTVGLFFLPVFLFSIPAFILASYLMLLPFILIFSWSGIEPDAGGMEVMGLFASCLLNYWLPAVLIFGSLVLSTPVFTLLTAAISLSIAFAVAALYDLVLAVEQYRQHHRLESQSDQAYRESSDYKLYTWSLCSKVFSSLVKLIPLFFWLASPFLPINLLVAGIIISAGFGVSLLYETLLVYAIYKDSVLPSTVTSLKDPVPEESALGFAPRNHTPTIPNTEEGQGLMTDGVPTHSSTLGDYVRFACDAPLVLLERLVKSILMDTPKP